MLHKMSFGVLSLILCVTTFLTGEEKGSFVDVSGARLYYEVRGTRTEKLPLIVVNGGPGFDHLYLHVADDVWNKLGSARPVIFYDQRGNGRSPELKESQSCTLADQIADLDALLNHLQYSKVDLLGHSWGGYLVMAYAARHPERISHLIICDSAAPKWQDTLFLFKDIFPETTARQEAVTFAETLGDEDALQTDLKEYFSMLFYSQEKRNEFLSKSSSFTYRKKINETLNNDVGRFDLNPELPKFKFPTLVLTGRYDINVAPSVAYKIHRAIPGSRFVVFEKSGHLPFFEEADSFIQIVEEFLSSSQ